MLRTPTFVRVVFVGWLVIAGVFAARLGGDGQDAFFITYRYARSVSQTAPHLEAYRQAAMWIRDTTPTVNGPQRAWR